MGVARAHQRGHTARLYMALRVLRGGWALLVAGMVTASLWPQGRARPPALPAPTLSQLDRSLGLARGYVDGLYHPVAGGAAVTSEYYGVPVRVRFPGLGWVEPGMAHVLV